MDQKPQRVGTWTLWVCIGTLLYPWPKGSFESFLSRRLQSSWQLSMHSSLSRGAEQAGNPNPKGPKYSNIGYLGPRVSILGIAIVILGRYLLFGYLDPQGKRMSHARSFGCTCCTLFGCTCSLKSPATIMEYGLKAMYGMVFGI